ncbi:MAG: beta-ketoacyl synthase chain length factor [Chitinophagales bacterium]|nr:beta-ketoacyl synthase chain length factor [Chitinophagales bacterium]
MLYINGTVCISPQNTSDNSVFLPEVKPYTGNKIYCVDVDYTKFFDPGSIRRMGRLIKFGTAAGMLTLKDAGVETPGAISTGTGYGLMDVSQKFLHNVIDSNETSVSPTSFIQSTHNTVSSNIALMSGCHAHNNTFAHRGFSFESSLLDAFLLAKEGYDNILVGAYDEVSDHSYRSMKRLGLLREEPCTNTELFTAEQKGTIAGEAAAFFLLSKEKNENTYGAFAGCKTFSAPANADELKSITTAFLSANNLSANELDVVVSGHCGDSRLDALNEALIDSLFTQQTILVYKQLCGEYMTSSAFAAWLAARIMKLQSIPETLIKVNRQRQPKNILLYNSHRGNHALLLFKHV